MRRLLPIVTIGPLLGRATGRDLRVLAVRQGPNHFERPAARCLAGEVTVHIDRTIALDEVGAALAHVGEGRALGKVVVTVATGQERAG